ncbi:hypothetical protein ACHAXT_012848 [Thalassiosira profunda]
MGATTLLPPRWALSLALLLIGVRAEFNFEVGRRIHERVSSLLLAPPTILLQLDLYRENGGFDSDLRATDRDAFFRLNDAFMETYPQFQSIYFGLEDGVFMGHGFNSKIANYREPGHSGYPIEGADEAGKGGVASDEAMQKHYQVCVNSTAGGEVPCTMRAGVKYTECTAPAAEEDVGELGLDCALAKCEDKSSQRNCDTIDNATAREECQANVKWCSAYAIKEAPENATLGFVQRSTHCIDSSGLPTQMEGEVVKKDQEELGNCYFSDGTTLVERATEEDFALCGGNGAVCNNTFDGAYISRDYDPRWRGWYIETKRVQEPNWSPPYPFFTSLEMGITYSRPIYSMQNGRNVFAGVLAVDYTFEDISRFLQDSYLGTEVTVAIIEKEEPYYMIASSTGSKNAKTVLVDDPTKPCPNPEIRDGSCKAERIKVTELSGENELISRAFLRQQERGFPAAELVTAKTSDESILYATQSKPFTIEDMVGLDWTIMIMTPVETEDADQIVKGDVLFGAVIAVAIFGFLLCAVLVGLIVRNRSKREIIVSDWRFLSGFVGACALLNMSCLAFLGPNTDELCLLRMWLIHWFIVLALSLLFVKVYRMYRLVGSQSVRRTTITHAQAARMALPLVIMQTFILLIFTLVDPNKRQEEVTNEGSDITHRYVCGHDTPAFFIVMLIVEGGLILIGCVLAFQTRNLRTEFNESRQIILAMYDTAFICSVLLIVSNVVVEYQGEQRMLFAIGIFWTTCFASGVFVIPRLMRLKNRGTSSSRVTVSGASNHSAMAMRSAVQSRHSIATISEGQSSTRETSVVESVPSRRASDAVLAVAVADAVAGSREDGISGDEADGSSSPTKQNGE